MNRDEMIDKMARALFAVDTEDFAPHETWENQHEDDRGMFRRSARAILPIAAEFFAGVAEPHLSGMFAAEVIRQFAEEPKP